jgi:hypothetical protein
MTTEEQHRSPLEQFFREYVDVVGGITDEVEPQVYDVLWPDGEQPQRVTFDSEALPEHPSAQLLTFGLPLLDEMLEDAQKRGQVARAYMDQVHQEPYGIETQVQRDLMLPKEIALEMHQVRPRYVLHTLFWFEATYLSDEKEQALYTAAVDCYYGRLVRHLEPLDSEHLSEERMWPHPDAPALSLARSYLLARERVGRNVTVAANTHQRERRNRLDRQIGQMEQYFNDMRTEVEERIKKAQSRGEEIESLHERIAALERERVLRIEELRRKAVARVQLQLASMLHLSIPRLFLRARLFPTSKQSRVPELPLTITWDPLVEKTDAIDCPSCHTPTYELVIGPRGTYGCPTCQAAKHR